MSTKESAVREEVRAVHACRDYDHWAAEIPRLSAAIGAIKCPRQLTDEWGSVDDEAVSCFQRAAREEFPGNQPDDGPTRRNLDAIAKVVANCPECSRLCVLIRERKYARQRLGVAKRTIRAIGRRALTSEQQKV